MIDHVVSDPLRLPMPGINNIGMIERSNEDHHESRPWLGHTRAEPRHRPLSTFVLPQSGQRVSRPSVGSSTASHRSLPGDALNPQFRHREVVSIAIRRRTVARVISFFPRRNLVRSEPPVRREIAFEALLQLNGEFIRIGVDHACWPVRIAARLLRTKRLASLRAWERFCDR